MRLSKEWLLQTTAYFAPRLHEMLFPCLKKAIKLQTYLSHL